MRSLTIFMLLLLTAELRAVDRAAILYRARCAKCHEPKNAGQTPDIRSLRRMSAEAVLESMETGTMRSVAEPMTDSQREMVAEFVSGKKLKRSGISSEDARDSRVGVGGRWRWRSECHEEVLEGEFVISRPDGSGKFSGSFEGSTTSGSIEGRVSGARIRFVLNPERRREWSGTLAGDRITGKIAAPMQPPCPFKAWRD